MLQLYSTKASRDNPPLQLNNTAKLYQEQGTSFLAFNKPVLKDEAIEYQLADISDFTAKSADVPLKITDQGAVLDNTFAKKGVFKLRYGDRGHDISEPFAYSTDMGGKAPRALGFGKEKQQGQKVLVEKGKFSSRFVGKKENADLAQYVKDTVGLDKRYDNIKSKRYEHMHGDKDVTYDPNKSRNASVVTLNNYNPLKAYEDYGYRQSDHWVKADDEEKYLGGMAMNVRKREKSYVMDIDAPICSEGSTLVNDQCVPFGRHKAHACPEGWEHQEGLGCVEKQEGKSDKPICLPGWYLDDKGMCAVKELAVAESDKTSTCNAVAAVGGALLVITLIYFIFKAAMQDNKPQGATVIFEQPMGKKMGKKMKMGKKKKGKKRR